VKGASEGEGPVNKFLANIREGDAIVHIVRAFDDDNVTHVSNKVSPADDIETINLELTLADLESITKRYDLVSKQARSGDKEAAEELAVYVKIKQAME